MPSQKGRIFSAEHRARISAAKKGPPPEVRFFARVNKDAPGGCWLWTGGLKGEGYGAFDHKRAHKFSWELVNGPVPPGLQLDHICRIRNCVNPQHLEAVTQQENIRRGIVGEVARARAAAQTHCYKGHLLAGDNLVLQGKAKTYRVCRTCRNNRQLSRYHKRKNQKGDTNK